MIQHVNDSYVVLWLLLLYWYLWSVVSIIVYSNSGSPQASLQFHVVLCDACTFSLYSGLTSTNWPHAVSTLGDCFPPCCPVVLFLQPPHLAAGLWAASLRWLIISCLSRDHFPQGPSSITLYQKQPYWTSSRPTRASNSPANNDSCSCQSAWAVPSIFLSAE